MQQYFKIMHKHHTVLISIHLSKTYQINLIHTNLNTFYLRPSYEIKEITKSLKVTKFSKQKADLADYPKEDGRRN